MAQNKTLELSIKIAGKVDKSLTTAINQTNTLMGSLTTTMSKVGTAGLAAMGALATATVAGLAKCTSEAAKLENNMSAMVRYVDGLTESATTSTEQAQSNLKAMRTYIQDLSTQIPRTCVIPPSPRPLWTLKTTRRATTWRSGRPPSTSTMTR